MVDVNGNAIRVEVDLLSGEYGGTGRKHRTQKVQDTRARKARGCDLAFDHFTEVELQGTLPDGARDQAIVRVASIVPFLVMKGMALADRLKEKDAWDIYFVATNYPGGVQALATEIKPYMHEGLVREGFEKINQKFGSPAQVGPKFVADFEDLGDPDERARIIRDAFERVDYLLRARWYSVKGRGSRLYGSSADGNCVNCRRKHPPCPFEGRVRDRLKGRSQSFMCLTGSVLNSRAFSRQGNRFKIRDRAPAEVSSRGSAFGAEVCSNGSR